MKTRDSLGAVPVLGLLILGGTLRARFSLSALRSHLTDFVGRTFTMPT